MRSARHRLIDIRESIERIERYAIRGRAQFFSDELIQSFIVMQLQIIGEASANLPKAVRDQAPTIPWKEIIGTRNIIVHGYFIVRLEKVWDIVERHLPPLKSGINALISTIP